MIKTISKDQCWKIGVFPLALGSSGVVPSDNMAVENTVGRYQNRE